LHFPNAEVETWLAADPNNPWHVVGVWQQDRWSNGGASGLATGVSFDGGHNWTIGAAPFTRCSGGNPGNGGDFERASDPWITFAPDGKVFQIALQINNSNGKQAVAVSRSSDGGLTWSNSIPLIEETSTTAQNDKESITADPHDARYVYAVWDRLAGLNSRNPNDFRGPALFSRTVDGGATWETARTIFDPGPNAQTIGNQIVVLPDGTLVDVLAIIYLAASPLVRDERPYVAVLRSADKGLTWSDPIVVSTNETVGVSNVKNGIAVRSGGILPSIAVDPVSGALYVVWADARFSAHQRDGIVLSRSSDGGRTWTSPAQVNQVPQVQAFTPAVAVGRGGELAIAYYDFRKDTNDPRTLMTTYWRIMSADRGETWVEIPLCEPFDLMTAPVANGLFMGDYHGLADIGGSMLSLFVTAGAGGDGNPSDVFAATRAANVTRTGNGHTEINRVPFRREIEGREKRKPVPQHKRR
jgi:hypothetical protein